jgi:hypothetical protein
MLFREEYKSSRLSAFSCCAGGQPAGPKHDVTQRLASLLAFWTQGSIRDFQKLRSLLP